MTTLPAMSDEQIEEIRDEFIAWEQDLAPYTAAIIAARDAQWQAAVDAAVMQERERILEICRMHDHEGYAPHTIEASTKG